MQLMVVLAKNMHQSSMANVLIQTITADFHQFPRPNDDNCYSRAVCAAHITKSMGNKCGIRINKMEQKSSVLNIIANVEHLLGHSKIKCVTYQKPGDTATARTS